MADNTINVNKKNVLELLSSGATKPFVIPEYQRPYAWTEEEVTTLFEDLWEFTINEQNSITEGTYFLGCIVSFENNGAQEIIDGQQRLTTLFLLLRAIYEYLSHLDVPDKRAINFIRTIGPAIWKTDKYDGEIDFKSILIRSEVINNDGNEILRKILETGHADPDAKDNYSKNYILLQNLLYSHIEKTLSMYNFIYAVLKQAILFPITADSQNTALIIFHTLNARGLPLSDADIFKAKIYNHLPDNKKEHFINYWKQLDTEAREIGETMQSLFVYYMFYLRAKDGDRKTTTPAVRRFFEANRYSRLFSDNLMMDLESILSLWKIASNKDDEDTAWAKNGSIKCAFDILLSYTNEFWKYPVLTYYMTYKDREDFESLFLAFLRMLIKELFTQYLIMPTLNAVKGEILKLNIDIIKSEKPTFEFKPVQEEDLLQRIKTPHRNALKMLLKIIAYTKQDERMTYGWEIEHIFPRKWKEEYVANKDEEYVKDMIEHIGNLLPFEKKYNILARNHYFKEKKTKYEKSKITVTRLLSQLPQDDWYLEDIEKRDNEVCDLLTCTFRKWKDDYLLDNITEEEKTWLKRLKDKGLV